MKSPEYKHDQWLARYSPGIEPINRFVDEIYGANGLNIPYVAPIYGGVNARMLNILRDPGPQAGGDKGSGFISMENNDPTAARLYELCENSGLKSSDLMLWNIFPWYINEKPTKVQLTEGLEPLKHILEMLPNLRVIMLHGVDAQRGWKMFEEAFPSYALEREIVVIPTFHTSSQAFIHRDPAVRLAKLQKLRDDFKRAAAILLNI
ncbi:MAG: uracil-DNA glycosylase [Chthonomonadales bacterium]